MRAGTKKNGTRSLEGHLRRRGSEAVWKDANDDDDCNGNKKRTGPVSAVTYQSLSAGGGVPNGDAPSSPGCSGMSASPGPEPGMPGGVDEVLRASVAEPLRDTQEVSITRTPMLWTHTHTGS